MNPIVAVMAPTTIEAGRMFESLLTLLLASVLDSNNTLDDVVLLPRLLLVTNIFLSLLLSLEDGSKEGEIKRLSNTLDGFS